MMDAVGCPKATIFVSGWSSMVGLVLAANYPDRVADWPRQRRGPFFVGGRLSVRRHAESTALMTVSYELDAVEQGVDVLEWLAPSVAAWKRFALGGTLRVIVRHRRPWPAQWRGGGTGRRT